VVCLFEHSCSQAATPPQDPEDYLWGVSIFGGVIHLSIEGSELRAQAHIEGVSRNGEIRDVVECFRNDFPVLVSNQDFEVFAITSLTSSHR
jgi:hypothetical protein